MRFVPYNTAATLTVELDERPDSAPTFAVYTAAGGSIQTGTSTLASVATTLSGSAAAGATTLSLTSASGVTAGHRYLLGGSEAAGGEVVTVRSIAATTATLVRPVMVARASGASVQSARVSVSVSAIATPGRHYRVQLAYAVGSVARAPVDVPFDVTRYVPRTTLTLEDVRSLDPVFARRLAAGAWWPDLRAEAWDLVLRRVAAQKGPGDLVGALDLTTAHAYAVRALAAELAAGAEPEHVPYRDQMYARLASELEAGLAAAAFDDDQDGAAAAHERWYRTVPVVRG